MTGTDTLAPHVVEGHNVPIRMWTDPATVEGQAMQQLRNVSSLPWIRGLAVMPDVHLDVIWTRCKQVADSVRGPEATRLRVLAISGIKSMPCATVTA